MSEYILIKNWSKYQTAKHGDPWVKDWVDKDMDYRYSQLTGFQRYIFDGLCRLRQRLGYNIPNDPVYIGRALLVLPKERKHIAQAIQRLTVVRGSSERDVCDTCGNSVKDVCDTRDVSVKDVCSTCGGSVKGVCGMVVLCNQRMDLQDIEENKKKKKNKSEIKNDKSIPTPPTPIKPHPGEDDDHLPA